MALGQRQNAHVETVEAGRIDRADFPGAGACRRFQLLKLEPELRGDKMRRFVQFRARAPGRTAGVVGKLHLLTTSLPSSRRAAPDAAVLTFRNVLIGSILPRAHNLTIRGRFASVRSP